MRFSLLSVVFIFCGFCFFGQVPQIRSIVVNSCSSGGNEGLDEIVIIDNGATPLNISDMTITFPAPLGANGVYCGTGSCGTRTLINNPAYLAALNTAAGCSIFQFATTIPAGARIMVLTGFTPTYVPNYSSQCGAGTTYVIFCNSIDASGHFANNPSPDRTLTINFGASTDAVTYTGAIPDVDGATANFTDAGVVSYATNTACIFPLSVKWLETSIYLENKAAILNWSTASETNNDFFEINEINDQGDFFKLHGKIDGNGTTNTQSNYSFKTEELTSGIHYFQLRQIDLDGRSDESKIMVINVNLIQELIGQKVENEKVDLFFSQVITGIEQISIMDFTGRILQNETGNHSNILTFQKPTGGIYIIRNNGTGELIGKIIVP